MQTPSMIDTDIETLRKLNEDYIHSVQHSDIGRFDQILAEEFYCSNPDGSLVDRGEFLRQTARPVMIRDLQAVDIQIRLFGNFAIIHARTTYTLADGRTARDATPTAGRGSTASGWPSRRT